MQQTIDYLWNNWFQILIIVFMIVVPVFTFRFYYELRFRRWRGRDRFYGSERFFNIEHELMRQRRLEFEESRSLKEAKESPLADTVDKKKEAFINIPNISFHFANKDEIKSFYNDYFKEPTVEQVVAEIANELSGEVKGALPKILEAKIGGKDIGKWISTIKLPDISNAEMFRRYQRETIKNDQVTLGIELVDVDLSDLTEFDEAVTELNTKFGFEIEKAKIEGQRAALKKKAAEKTLVRLENVTGTVLIEGKFKITTTPDNFYRCIYDHPVNEYISGEGKNVAISIILRTDSIEPSISGNYSQSIGKTIPLRVYGKVWQPIDRKADIWDLQITPIAVY